MSTKRLLHSLCAMAGILFVWGFFAMPTHAVQTQNTQSVGATVVDENFTFSSSDSTLDATADVTLTFSLNADLHSGDEIFVRSSTFAQCDNWDTPECYVQLNVANGITGINATLFTHESSSTNDSAWVRLTSDLPAGTHTLTFNNVINPSVIGGQTMNIDIPAWIGGGNALMIESANSVIYGTPAIQGTITDQNGDGVSGIWVNAWPTTRHDLNGRGSNTGPDGQYAIGGLTSGVEYNMSMWLPENYRNGNVAPAQENVTYAGTPLTQNYQLEAAVKKISLTVVYDDTGEAVTNANVWANNTQGSGGVGEDVNENGVSEFYVPKGTAYHFNLSAKWDQQNNRPFTTDWIYNDQGLRQTATFANDNTLETFSHTFRVTRTNARVTGKVINPEGVLLANIGLDIRNREGIGNWGSTDDNGEFNIPLPSGSYTINIWRDNNSAEYFKEKSISIEPGEILDVGTLQMSRKDAAISGRVVDENGTGIADIRVNGWTVNRGHNSDNKNNGWSGATTDANGAFTMSVFSGARWAVNIDQGENSRYIQTDTNYSQFEFDIAENETVSGVVLHVKLSDVTIYARVVDANNELLTNVWGHIEAYDPLNPHGGQRYWGNLNGGSATINAVSGPADFELMAWFPPESGYSIYEPVTVPNIRGGETYQARLLVVQNDAAIRGTVKDEDGDAITGVEAEVYAMDIDYPIWRNGRVNTDTGTYNIDLIGGRQYMINSQLFDTSEYINSNDGGTIITVREGQTFTHDVNVTSSNASIQLTALSPEGSPLEYVWFWCNNYPGLEAIGDFDEGRQLHIGSESDASGRATLAATDGTWECSAGMDSSRMEDYLPPNTKKITVEEGETASARLQFKRSDGVLTGIVTMDEGGTLRHGGVYAWSPEGGHSWAPIEGGSYRLPLSNGTWWVGADSVIGKTFYRANETELTFSGSGTLDFVLTAESFEVPESKSFTFANTSQQHLVFEDGTELLIPAESLGSDGGNVTVTGSPTGNLRHMVGDKPVAYGMDFDAVNANNESITRFNTPVTLRIPYYGYRDKLDEEGIDENELSLDYWDDTKNAYESTNATQNSDSGYFETQVDHFTIFSINSSTGGNTMSSAVLSAASTSGPKNLVVTPLSKGGPQIALWDVNGTLLGTWFAYSPALRIGVATEVGDLDADGYDDVISYPAHSGVVAHVRMFNHAGGLLGQFYPYGNTFKGRIHVRMADLDGDGNVEIVTYPHDGPQSLLVFDRNGNMITTPLDVGSGGGWLELADVDNNGTTEMIVAAPRANGRVKVIRHDKTILSDFDAFWITDGKGVASLNVADVDNDNQSEIVVSADGNGSNVRVYEYIGTRVTDFNAYADSFKGGARVAVGNIDGTPELELIALPNVNGSAHVRVFTNSGGLLSTFFAYPPASTRKGMFHSAVADLDADGTAEIVSGTGVDLGPQVRIFDARGAVVKQFMALHEGFRGGIILNTISQ